MMIAMHADADDDGGDGDGGDDDDDYISSSFRLVLNNHQ